MLDFSMGVADNDSTRADFPLAKTLDERGDDVTHITVAVKRDHITSFESDAVPPIGSMIYVSADCVLQFAKEDPRYYLPDHIEHLRRIDGMQYEVVGQQWELRLKPGPENAGLVVRLQCRLA